VALLILVAGMAFNLHLQTKTEYPPPILDPEFGLWVSDPNIGGSRPMVWDLEYVKGVGDQVTLREAVPSGKKALEIQIFQDGADDKWVYVYLRQKIDGARLRALFDMEIWVWVLSKSSCACKETSMSQQAIFGIETNDGAHLITFIFSDRATEWQHFPNHRIVILPTPPEEWTVHRIDIAREYDRAQWKRPDWLSFSILLEAAGSAAGWHTGYVHSFSWTQTFTSSSAQQSNRELTTLLGLWLAIRWAPVEEITFQLSGPPAPPRSTSSAIGYESVARV